MVVAGIAGLLGAVLALRLWHAHLGVPFSYGGDALFYEAIVKGALDHGWVISNPDLGAPSGLDLQDFPLFSVAVVPFLIIKAVGVLTGGDVAHTINLYFLLTFSLASASAYLLLRWLRVTRLVAVACGALFAIAPYHLWHGQGHLLASSYYLVPAGVYLTLALLRGDPLLQRRSRAKGPLSRWASPTTLGTLGLCVLIGWSDVYYVAFTIVLVLGAALVAALGERSPRRFLMGLGLVGAMGAATLIALTPALIYRIDNGANQEVAKRGGVETETYSTNLAQLAMPIPGHPVSALDDLQARYREASEVGGSPHLSASQPRSDSCGLSSWRSSRSCARYACRRPSRVLPWRIPATAGSPLP